MLAIQYRKSIPGFLAVKLLGRFFPSIGTSSFSPTRLSEIPEPTLPGERWVKIKTTMGAVCGSDLSTIACKGSPYFSPFLSFPFTLGHENVGRIVETGKEVTRFQKGDRVVIEPVLGCEVRDAVDWCTFCKKGEYALCENVTHGPLSRGIQTGYCHDTGGSWGEYFVAHETQLHVVPASVSDEEAVLIEPFSTALHAALRHFPENSQHVLLIGCGAIGLMVLQALRGMGSKARITCAARYPHQAELAKRFGASETVSAGRKLDQEIARLTGADLLVPELGHKVVIGGVDRTFDCVASSASLDDAIRCTRGGGQVVVVGMPGIPSGIDWTPLWYKSLQVSGSYCYGWENRPEGKKKTMDLAIDLVSGKKLDLRPLLTHRFPIRDYRKAIGLLMGKKKDSRAIKVAFTFS